MVNRIKLWKLNEIQIIFDNNQLAGHSGRTIHSQFQAREFECSKGKQRNIFNLTETKMGDWLIEENVKIKWESMNI